MRVKLITAQPYCGYCGARPGASSDVELDIDHIIPRAKGGGDDIENLQVLCHRCNRAKNHYLLPEASATVIREKQMDYTPDCIFCDAVKTRALFQNEYAYVMLDGFPVSAGHTLIIPTRHIADAGQLTDTELVHIFGYYREVASSLKVKDPTITGFNIGFNIGKSAGQTVFHAPRIFHGLEGYPNATLQIGDGDHLARRTGIITVSDFRQKHLAAGGEGAPLALYGDYFLFSKTGEDRFLLNIGGIANFTFLPGDADSAKAFATDTGPGNTLIDRFAQELFDMPYDKDALLASTGRVDPFLLEGFKSEPYFSKPFPKTTGPEQFSRDWVESWLRRYPKGSVNPYDLMATLTQLSADTICEALRRVPPTVSKRRLYLSGGGAHNPMIVRILQEDFPQWRPQPMSALGSDADA